jgi:hypothetical protein
MVKTDRIVAIVLIGIALFLFTKTGNFIDKNSVAPISAAFFPRFILIALIICSLWLAIRSKMPHVQFPELRGTSVAGSMIVGYVLLINPVGYFITTPLFLFAFPAAIGYRKWGWLTGLAVGGTMFSYFVFYKILGVPLPMGMLEGIGWIL